MVDDAALLGHPSLVVIFVEQWRSDVGVRSTSPHPHDSVTFASVASDVLTASYDPLLRSVDTSRRSLIELCVCVLSAFKLLCVFCVCVLCGDVTWALARL
jgi:hypothetical protein